MKIRWSKVAPQLALTPALAVTFAGFFVAILWTVYLSFTASRRFPDYTLVGFKQYVRLFRDGTWLISLENVVILAIGSLASIVLGFILAALIDKEVRGEGVFRTVFLYPLAVSLIVTGLVWRWMFNPGLGVENFFHSIGWDWVKFNLVVFHGFARRWRTVHEWNCKPRACRPQGEGHRQVARLLCRQARLSRDAAPSARRRAPVARLPAHHRRPVSRAFSRGRRDRAPADTANGVNHFCLTVDGIEDVVTELQARGVPLFRPLKEGADYNRQAWVEDPDGNRIELMEMSPRALQFAAIERLRKAG